MFHRKGAEEAHFDQPDLLAPFHQPVDRLFDGLRAGTHQDDHPLGVGRTHIVEEAIDPTCAFGELGHHLLDNAGQGRVEGVDGLAGLEVDIRVLGRAPDEGAIRRQGAGAVGAHSLVVDEGADVVVVHLLDFVDLVAGAEAVQNIEEGNPAIQGGGLGDEGEVLTLLDGVGEEHPPARAPGRHHIAVITENGESLGGQRAGGDVKDSAGQLPGDLVHIGDHQQQPLAGCESGGQGASLQRAVDCPGCAPFRLHLYDEGFAAPDILIAPRGPGVGQLAHRRGGGDGVDGYDFVGLVGNVGRSLVAVKGHFLAGHYRLLRTNGHG